jgi:hypothetical protein
MGILSPVYDASFDSVSFFELAESGFYPGVDVGTEGTLQSLTGGTHIYTDMGQSPLIFEIQAGVEGTQKAALLTKRGVTGSLIWSRGTMTVKLLDITPSEADAVNGNTLTLKFFTTQLPGAPSVTRLLTDTRSALLTDSGDYLTE